MNKRILSLLVVTAVVIMSLSLAGCSAKEPTPQDIAMVKAASMIADEKLPFIFDQYTPEGSDTTYYVGKEHYQDLESVKKYLSAYFTEDMINNTLVADYIKVQDVPGKGNVTTLNLPEDYPTILGHTFTDADTITIDGNNATIKFAADEKTATYELEKVDGKWLVASKSVE